MSPNRNQAQLLSALQDLEEMIREADVLDHDGRISKDEFFRVMKRQNAYASVNPPH